MKKSDSVPKLLLLVLVGLVPHVYSAEGQELTALVIEARGRMGYLKAGSAQILPVQANVTRLREGDSLATDKSSKATLRIEGKTVSGVATHPPQSILEVGPDTLVRMNRLALNVTSRNEEVQIGVPQGQIISNVRRINPNSERFEIATPTSIAAVRGTEFTADVRRTGKTIKVLYRVVRGSIVLQKPSGERIADLQEGDYFGVDSSGVAAPEAAPQTQGAPSPGVGGAVGSQSLVPGIGRPDPLGVSNSLPGQGTAPGADDGGDTIQGFPPQDETPDP